MVLIFLLSLFSVAQFTLSNALSSRDSAIDQLSRQIGDLANQLSIEKRAGQSLQKDLEQLTLQLGQLRAERDKLGGELAAERRSSDALKVERDQLTERADLDAGRARQARRRACRAPPRNPRPRPPTCRRRSSASGSS